VTNRRFFSAFVDEMGGQEEVRAMNGKGVQKRQRAVKFSRTPKPISPSDHDGTFVGAPPQRVDPKVRCMPRTSADRYCR
jgi:hypothetical protein